MAMLTTVGAIEIGANDEMLRPNPERSASYVKAFWYKADLTEKVFRTSTAVRIVPRKIPRANRFPSRIARGLQFRVFLVLCVVAYDTSQWLYMIQELCSTYQQEMRSN